MNNSLWAIIALVSAIVGFLMGYSVSSYTGTRTAAEYAPSAASVAGEPAVVAGSATDAAAHPAGYGAPEAPKKAATSETGGYGGPGGEKPKESAGGYGAPEPRRKALPKPSAPRAPAKPAPKPAVPAAGY